MEILFHFFFFSFGHPMAYGGPRPRIRSVPQLQPVLKLWQGEHLNQLCLAGIKPAPSAPETLRIPLRHSGKKYCLQFFVCLFCFLGPHPQYTEIPRVGGTSELHLPAYATATATRILSQVWDLHHSSRQRQMPDPLSEARDGTCILIDTSWIHFCCITTGTPVCGNF